MIEEKEEERQKEERKKKTYSFDKVKAHIDIYAQMVFLTECVEWKYGSISSRKRKDVFKEAIEKAENEFLEEFKDEKFYYILGEMKKRLK